MDARQALADLAEISSQIKAAVLVDEQGSVLGSTVADEGRARGLAEAGRALLEAADRTRRGAGPEALTQLEAATAAGSVFVVRSGGRVLAATTTPEPTVGLVFYDLKSCLRNATEEAARAKPTKRSAKKKPPGETESGNAAS